MEEAVAEADQTLIENEAARSWAADNRDDPGKFATQDSATRAVYIRYVENKLGLPLERAAS